MPNFLIIIQSNMDGATKRANIVASAATHPEITSYRFVTTFGDDTPFIGGYPGLRFWTTVFTGNQAQCNAIITDIVNNYHAAFPTHKVTGERLATDIVIEV